jgi:branched-chain amino acid transport system permease protein
METLFWQHFLGGLTLGGIYALIAVGYTMVYGIARLINFAHGEIYMMGAYLAMTFAGVLGLPFGLAFVLTVACCAALGVLTDRVAYLPLRGAPRLAPLITAIGVSLVLQNLARIVWGAATRPFPQQAVPEIFGRTLVRLGGVDISVLQAFIVLVAWTLMLGLSWLVLYTDMGKAMRATREDPTMALLLGINPNRIIAWTFAVGSALGGTAGFLVGMYYNAIFPTMGYTAGVKAFAAAVLGGIGNIPGAVLGGMVLGMGEVLGSAYLSSAYSHGVAYAIMIGVIIFRPAGLLGALIPKRA